MPGWYYHYIDDPAEVTQIKDDRRIQSMQPSANPLTWYTPTRYDNPSQAQQDLSMSKSPTHRVGGIPDAAMPTFHVSLRLAPAAHGQPGGGVEAATRDIVWLCGLWNFAGSGSWDL
ncbi:MAG: hypothetical protein ACRERE_45355 [Candidatus Entotheonellia bacterium]